jgi:hypothetical protein
MNNTDTTFSKIEQCCRLWKGLENEKNWYQQYPELLNIIEGATIRLRLEIILLCQQYLKEEKPVEHKPVTREEYLKL